MRKRLQHGLQEFEILTYGESRPDELYLEFPEDQIPLELLRRFVQYDPNLEILRQALEEVEHRPDYRRMNEHAVLKRVSTKLVSGELRIALPAVAPKGGGGTAPGEEPEEPEEPVEPPPAVVKPTVNPIITTVRQVVIVKKSYTNPTRQQVTLKTDSAFDGSGTFTRSSNAIRFFSAAVGGTEITFNGADNVFAGNRLTSGINVFAEGASPSNALDDVILKLTLTPGSAPVGPAASAMMTSVEVVLDICQSHTAPTTDPTPMSAGDKINTGRFIQVQDAGNHCGRAKLIVRQAKPAAFAGELELTAIDNKVQLFAAEVAATGQSPIALPHALANSTIPAAGSAFWVQGATVSGALRDTGFRLGVKNVEPDGDKVTVTAVRFKNLKADIPSTPANTVRASADGAASNSPVPRHELIIANGGATEKDLDEDFVTNEPLVLVEGSIKDDGKITLTVEVEPAAAKPVVAWSVQRDQRAGKGDHATIVALPDNHDDPGLVADGGDQLKATLVANAVGSFHIRPYIDCNGNTKFDHNDNTGARIDREPFLIMNLVVIRVQGINNLSVANSAAGSPGIMYVGGRPRRVRTGDFAGTGNDAVEMKATVRVIGGGQDGKRGLDKLFCGWVNNELNCPTSPSPNGWSEDVTHHHRRPPLASPLRRLRCFWELNGAAISGPVLDSGYAGQGTGGDSCTGTAGANNPQPTKVDDPSGIGQRWESKNVDSPGGGITATSPGDAAATLRRFTFNIDFQCALVFWTNRNGVSGPANHPACRLYSSVQTNTWNIRLESTFDGAFTETVVVAKTVTFTKDADATRKATPVAGSGLETRLPDGLTVLKADQPF